jgi:hypothetical protein
VCVADLEEAVRYLSFEVEVLLAFLQLISKIAPEILIV